MKKLFLICISLFAFSAFADDLGRVKLTLPPGEWITLYTKDSALRYTGGEAGKLASKKTARALLDKDKNLLALVLIEGGGYGVGGNISHMEYNEGCKKLSNEYVFDKTKGSYTALDCLRVWRSVASDAWIKRLADVHAEFVKLGVKFETNSYLAAYKIGTPNGTYSVANAYVAHSALKNIPDAAKGEKYAGMPGVAYGHLLADAVRASAYSLSGELVVPQIDYR